MELNSLPEKSREKYEQTYKKFMNYRIDKKIESISEDILIAYFAQMSRNSIASTLWASYSMLKTTLNVNENVDISRYLKLRAFLKKKSLGYQAKKSRVLEMEHIEKFLLEAPDKDFLSTKVALVIGVVGACRGQELVRLKITDIVDMHDKLLITLPDTRADRTRSFFITKHLDIYRKYTAARPPDMDSPRFFFKYTDGKSYKQVIGKHKFGKMPQEIAKFLKLPNAIEYTGHCLRKTSGALLATSNARWLGVL
ncbi:unnamed protein product [Ceutorhynchus assimilis]|uniref:Tyr recombinase domain-containing protein n=1 Tax=Ceutorhynchus assimilis TaxID=467358 RepID=A0A9P0DL79_9CUCU|nr:unnamed protein product [Ceutorhynchus assimilis]